MSMVEVFAFRLWVKNIGKCRSYAMRFESEAGVLANASDSGRDKQPLAQAIEQLLQNITISPMGSPQFQSSSPKLTEVTKITYHNVYIYTKYKLWIAYGVAIACASTAVAIGLHVIFSTHASYSSDFSTILRVARGAALSNEVEAKDADGKDPLPVYLKKSSIAVSSERQMHSAEDEESKHLHSVVESRGDWIYPGSDAPVLGSHRRTASREGEGDSQFSMELQDISGSSSTDGPDFRGR